MKTAEVRQKFLKFFGANEHVVKDSFSLIPSDDPTLLFNSAGMAPFKPYFLGIKTDIKRAASCQKCFRTTDIENVGYTARHHTFFEMLGNFSFGDYFKKEAIAWAWEFCTKTMNLPADRLYISVHHSDDEAYEIWNSSIGIPADRLVRLGDKDNFWTIGVGPSGPCSEIYIDQGPELSCGQNDCAPGCDCARYLEFWNLVFTQYNRAEDGTLTPLEKKNIDTGMGLERLAAIVQGKTDNYHNDLFQGIVAKAEGITGHRFGESPVITTALKVVADHIRALSFAIADGAFPGSEGRGYVLRKILRRASRFGYQYLGREKPFLYQMVPTVAEIMDCYPEVREHADHIGKVVHGEEERFLTTLKTGTDMLSGYVADLRTAGGSILEGGKAFLLHDTYGFPLDLTREICREQGLTVDADGFNTELEKQRERGRAHAVAGFSAGAGDALDLTSVPATEFLGYTTMKSDGNVLAVNETGKGTVIITDRSPFYGTSGGQVGDFGVISSPRGRFLVETTDRDGDIIVHRGRWDGSDRFGVGDSVALEVDVPSRRAIMRNHTATHLLHKALRRALGEHVHQAGSMVSPDRLRFDFTHYEGISPETLEQIEREVNARVLDSLPVTVSESSYAEAVKTGAMALFGEKYGDVVRMIRVGDYSLELCGGTHLNNSAEIALFSIASESSIASGVRRIEAITGAGAMERVKKLQHEQISLARLLDCDSRSLLEKVEKLLHEQQTLKGELDTRRKQDLKNNLSHIRDTARKIGDVTAIFARVDGLTVDEMKALSDDLVGNQPMTVTMLAGASDKANFVMKVSKDLTGKLHAGNLIREIAKVAGGGGGGRPDMATAGGKDLTKIDEALKMSEKLVSDRLPA
jgi:alanyl-tRNA synthetase